ncbi:MAG: recombinase family protein [Thermoguttaceae bacterium]|jgi:DNA invertase Pin-like site-specific DNA recombinase
MVKMPPLVGYIRVSTKRQGRSGLGLEAQQEALDTYRRDHGGRVLATYREIETGKTADRPELARAIAHAKRSGATLVVAKLDRLARNAAFLLTLQASGLPMVFLDLPGANEFTVGVMALVAQHEAQLISQRTKDALAAYKKRRKVSKRIREAYPDGVPDEIVVATAGKLGASLPQCRNLTQQARKTGAQAAGRAVKKEADQAYVDLLPQMVEWRAARWSQQHIADELNQQGHTTRRGKRWNQVQVMRVLARA